MGEFTPSFLQTLPDVLHTQAEKLVDSDPAVTVGQLSNGLRYYIRPHQNPGNRAYIRLVMHVGSLNEDDDQRGLAHILEHMAFNGSTNFAPQALDAYFQSIGMQFGAHVNASTGFDKTIYKLEIPTDDPSIIEQTFRILEDWGQGLLLLEDQIEKERRVGLEEWRGRQSGRMRTMEQMLPTLYWGAKHVERLPIGTEESLNGFEHDALKRFYQDWYRPNLCSLVIVGDVDVEQMEQKIQRHLADWRNESQRPTETVEVPIPADRMIDIIQDATIPYPMFVYSQKKPIVRYKTEGGWAQNILTHELMISAINERFKFLHRNVDSKVQQASIMESPLTNSCVQEGIHVVLDAQDWQASIREVMCQFRQLRQFGLTEGELERAKERRLVALKAYRDNIPTATSNQFLRDIMSVVLDGDSMWPPEALTDLSERWTPCVSLDAINERLSKWLSGTGKLIHFLTPTAGITASDIEGILDEAMGLEIEEYVETLTEASLLPAPLPKGRKVSERLNETLDIREWVFENGVTVWLKQTDFEEDMIGWSGYGEGGYSQIDNEALYSAKVMPMAMQFVGAGPHSVDDLSRLTDVIPGMFRWMVSDNYVQVVGQATREGLLPSLQHAWLESQAVAFTPQSMDKVKSVLTTRLSNDDDPETVFSKRRREILNQGHPRSKSMELSDLDSIELSLVQDAYNTLIQPASQMHFIVIGNFDWDAMLDVLSQTLGALPATEGNGVQDRGVRLVEDCGRHELRVFDEPKGEVGFHFVHTKLCDSTRQYEGRLLTKILQERLRKSLREQEAGTYHVSANWGYNRYTHQIHFQVGFGCSPERVQELEGKALSIIQSFVSDGITGEELELERGKMLRAYEKSMKKNGHWLARMSKSLQVGRDLMEIPDQLSAINRLTVEGMNDCLKEFYCLQNQTVIVGLPLEDAS